MPPDRSWTRHPGDVAASVARMRSPGAWLICRRVTRIVDRGVGTPVQTRRAAEIQSSTIVLGEAGGLRVRREPLDVDGGRIDLYVYEPAGSTGAPRPAHVMLHAGGFWAGNAATADARCRELTAALRCVCVSVEYRRAPEHPYPVPLLDSLAALRWTAAQARALGVDPDRISLGGVSCGGALATAAALVARDEGPALAGLVLETPVLDLTMSQPSARRRNRSGVVSRRTLGEGYAFYAPDPDSRTDGLVSPMLAAELAGLPPTVILVAEHDPLHDEGVVLARRLREAGVPVELVTARGHAHATVHLGGRFFGSAGRYRAQVTEALRGHYRLAS